MTAGMKFEICESQLLTATQFIDKCLTRFFQPLGLRMTKINQVAVVGQNLLRRKIISFTVLSNVLNAFLTKRFGLPLTLIFGKESKGCGAYCLGVKWCIFDAASRTNVGSNIFHRRRFSGGESR